MTSNEFEFFVTIRQFDRLSERYFKLKNGIAELNPHIDFSSLLRKQLAAFEGGTGEQTYLYQVLSASIRATYRARNAILLEDLIRLDSLRLLITIDEIYNITLKEKFNG